MVIGRAQVPLYIYMRYVDSTNSSLFPGLYRRALISRGSSDKIRAVYRYTNVHRLRETEKGGSFLLLSSVYFNKCLHTRQWKKNEHFYFNNIFERLYIYLLLFYPFYLYLSHKHKYILTHTHTHTFVCKIKHALDAVWIIIK